MHQETLVAREPNTACAVTVQVARWLGMPAGIENLTCQGPQGPFRYWTRGMATSFWLRLQQLDRMARRHS